MCREDPWICKAFNASNAPSATRQPPSVVGSANGLGLGAVALGLSECQPARLKEDSEKTRSWTLVATTPLAPLTLPPIQPPLDNAEATPAKPRPHTVRR
jgi:hypothetical protein